MFVNSADSGMRVRLFLEAFGVPAAVLSAELPLNSRHHILQARPRQGWPSAGWRRRRRQRESAAAVVAGSSGSSSGRAAVLALCLPGALPTCLPANPACLPYLRALSCPSCGAQEFNRGLFDYLIATDDVHAGDADGSTGSSKQQRQKKGSRGDAGGGKGAVGGKRQRKEEEFGVTRGIDFKGVRTVINFEMPGSTKG